MGDSSTDDGRRRRRPPNFGQAPIKVVSDLSAGLPVTEAEINLLVAMLGGADGVRRKLVELGIMQADVDDAVAVSRRPPREPTV